VGFFGTTAEPRRGRLSFGTLRESLGHLAAREEHEAGPKYILSIESKEIHWPKSTITTEEIAALGNWDASLGVQEVNLVTGEARTLAPGEVVELQPGKGFSKKIGWRRG
jgi:hypothetical protein